MRETFKDVDVRGRKFRINKFDALTGSYVIYTVLTQVLPMGMGKKVAGLEESSNLPAMTKEKFRELQMDCLRVCSEIKPAGNSIVPVPVLMADGRWGIEDLENDSTMVMALTIQALGYNVQSFFEGDALTLFKDMFQSLNASDAKM
jgi:hypothetical protein